VAHRPCSSYSQERKDKQKQYVTENRRKKKAQAIDYKGGQCRVCGYKRCAGALHFHHLDPNEKDFVISRVGTWAWSRIVNELDKCVLLCGNCHAEVHEGLLDLRGYLTPEEIEKAVKAAEDNGPNILNFFS